MWDVRVCAACLATNVRMYSMSAARLLQPYRLLSGLELESEAMPQKLCWECAALVHKFNMFRHKCERASLLLQEIYNQHDEVSEQEVLRVNREQHNLMSSYTICSIQAYDVWSLKTKSKKCQKNKKSKAEKTNHKQTDNAPMEPFVMLEIIKKEEVAIESEVNGTELIPDTLVKDDCLQAVQAELPRKIKPISKRRHGSKRKQKKEEVAIESEVNDTELIPDTLVEDDCLQAVQAELPRKIKPISKRRNGSKPKQKKERKAAKVLAKDFGMKQELLSQEQQMAVMRERQNTEGYRLARFPCTLCYNPFNMEKAFNNHMLKHDPVSGEFICDLCKLRYKNKRTVRRHVSAYHMNKYSCRSCPTVFYNRSSALKHYAWHKGVVYTCRICGATFNKQTSQLNHLRMKHSSEQVCDQCGEPFHSEKGLRQHIQIAHKLQRYTVTSGGEHDTSGPYCAECDVQFTCKQAWTRHVLISPKHRHERHICALGCETCGEMLPNEESLKAHRVTHIQARMKIAVKPIKCEQCGEAMESNRAYHAHFRSSHRGKTRTHYPAMRAPCMCELCGKVFQSKGHLKQHSYKHTGEQRHTDERRYQCDVCSKKFVTKQVLSIHIRTHTKEMPFKCGICGQRFNNYANMYRHKSVHTDERPYPCETCGKRFKCRRTVATHMQHVHMKRPWPKRDRSERQHGTERRSRGHKRKLLEHV